MNFFKLTLKFIASRYYRIREIISPSEIRDGYDIPIIINNFNRVSTLKQLIASLECRGYNKIFIIDNNSSYQPLLDYYEICPYTVFRLTENLGFRALWKSGLSKQFCQDYYVYTDSDVVPVDECPADFIDQLLQLLKLYPYARKIGLSLRIDNLPDHYKQKAKVVEWESRFFSKPNERGIFRAPVDTTFALYRPRVGLSRSRYVEAYRTPFPLQLHHLPWYQNSSDMTEEDRYYQLQCEKETMWSKR